MHLHLICCSKAPQRKSALLVVPDWPRVTTTKQRSLPAASANPSPSPERWPAAPPLAPPCCCFLRSSNNPSKGLPAAIIGLPVPGKSPLYNAWTPTNSLARSLPSHNEHRCSDSNDFQPRRRREPRDRRAAA